jgi:hypothetical protein
MRVFGRSLILAALLCAFAPSRAGAAPILGTGSTGCTSVLGSDPTTCSLLNVDPFGTGAIEGEFTFHNDVALFTFTLTGDTLFSARTTSFSTTGFDSTFAVFNTDANFSMVQFPDGSQYAHSEDISLDPDDPNYDDQLASFELTAGTYILALVMWPNEFSHDAQFGLADSLLAGFFGDAEEPVSCAPSCGFSLDIDATLIDDGGPQQVPEPATFALVASGALAALMRRRSRKRISRDNVVRS